MGRSGHVLHVVGSMTLTELRDAQILSGFIKLQNKHQQHGVKDLQDQNSQVRPEPGGRLITLSLLSGPSMETSSISSPMLSSLLDRSDRWLKQTQETSVKR